MILSFMPQTMQKFESCLSISVWNATACEYGIESDIESDIAEIAESEYENGSPTSRFRSRGVGVHVVASVPILKMTEVVRQIYKIR